MNVLSLLGSGLTKTVENGHWGYADDGQYDFVITSAPSHVLERRLLPEEINLLAPIIPPCTIDIIRVHLGRLALIKKIGSASEMTMGALIGDMAFEIAEFSQAAVLMAFREIKRSEGPWMPELGLIIKICEKYQEIIDSIYAEIKSTTDVKVIEKHD